MREQCHLCSHPPGPSRSRRRRVSARPRLIAYQRLALLVGLVNLGLLWSHLARGDWSVDDGSALSGLASLTLVNLAVAVLIRQQTRAQRAVRARGPRLALVAAVAALERLEGAPRRRAPRRRARSPARRGCARSPVVAIATPADGHDASRSRGASSRSPSSSCACAAPVVRRRAHNVFELTHRFGGWTAIALFWVLTLHLGAEPPAGWHVWVLALVTASIASPWLRLRRVPVTVERPSSHAAIVHFDHGVSPAFASAVGISRSPLREWHAFATVTTPGRAGFRLLDLARGRLDRPLHRRSAVARVGARHARLGADGQGRAALRARRLRRHRQRDRARARADPRRARAGAAGLVDARRRAPPTATRSSTRSRRRSPDARDLGHDRARQARPRRARPRGVPRLRRRGRLRGQQQADDVAARARAWSELGIPAFGPIWDS